MNKNRPQPRGESLVITNADEVYIHKPPNPHPFSPLALDTEDEVEAGLPPHLSQHSTEQPAVPQSGQKVDSEFGKFGA